MYEACRKGMVRVSLNGKEIQHLRERLEPISWELFMASSDQAKFGPEKIEITPKCDTVECAFDFVSAVQNKGFTFLELCAAGPGPFRETAYLVKRGAKFTYLVVAESVGSGGKSTSLTLHLKKPDDARFLCASAKKAESKAIRQ
jgi:hypothetical protein